MKRPTLLRSAVLSLILCLTAVITASGQTGCDFNIVGTWKPATAGQARTLLYRFAPEGTVAVLTDTGSVQGSAPGVIASATYTLDNMRSPTHLTFTTPDGGGVLTPGTTSIEITRFDDASFSTATPSGPPMQWIKVEPFRYFIVLAGRSGTFYDDGGPAFPMLIKTDGGQPEVAAVGIYAARGKPAFGSIPPDVYREFLNDTRNASDVMLRLEIGRAQYDRALKVIRTWDRRAREGALLYPDISMDNILLAKQVTETLNHCSNRVKLYNLDWGVEDEISDKNKPTLVPFKYFRELRRLNEAMHVSDEKFRVPGQSAAQ